MGFKKVECVECDECGMKFMLGEGSGKTKDPQRALWAHKNKTKVPCSHKRKLTELEDFKKTLTVEGLEEIKQLKKHASASSEMLQKMDRMQKQMEDLRAESREKQTLQFTIINLSPQVLACSTNLNPIQTLESLDLSEERFREMLSAKYPYPSGSAHHKLNVPSYTKRIQMLQAIHPVSIKDEMGNVFYRDKKVLKVDQDGTVSKCLLKALSRTDETAALTDDLLSTTRPEQATFLNEILKAIADVHLAISSS